MSTALERTPSPSSLRDDSRGASLRQPQHFSNPQAQALGIDTNTSCPASPTAVSAEFDPHRLVPRQTPQPLSPPLTPGEDSAAKYRQWAAYDMSAGAATAPPPAMAQAQHVDLAEPIDERDRQFSTTSTAPSFGEGTYRESLSSSTSSADQPFTPRESHSGPIKIETFDTGASGPEHGSTSPPSQFLNHKDKESPIVGAQQRLWEYRDNGVASGSASGSGSSSGVGLSTGNDVRRPLSAPKPSDMPGATSAGVRTRPAISPTKETFDPFTNGKAGAITPPGYTGTPHDSSNPYAGARYNASPYASLSGHPQGHHAGYGASEKSQHLLTSVPTQTQAKPGWSDSTAYWLTWYFAFNLGLTLFNKLVLVNFPFAYTLTGLHALSGSVGCYIALQRGMFVPAHLTSKDNMIMGAFSVLYTINIAVSNLSLHLVSVPFHQVVRASTPLFTIFLTTIFFRARCSSRKLISLLPVVAGVGFATYGAYDFTAWGLILTLLGTFLAALKTVVTNVIQTGTGGRLRLHPLDLLMRMSPLAFIQCVIYAWYSGELERVRKYGATEMTRGKAIALLLNGVIAFGLNIVSFTANKKAGPLTMTVSANCKQVLTIAIAVVMFDVHITPTNGLGIMLTLVGGGWYAYIEYLEKTKSRLGKLVERP